MGLPRWSCGKELAWQCMRCRRCRFDPCIGKIPWSRKWATHSSILDWKIPWAEEAAGLQSMGSQTVGHDLVIGHDLVTEHSTAYSGEGVIICVENGPTVTKMSYVLYEHFLETYCMLTPSWPQGKYTGE